MIPRWQIKRLEQFGEDFNCPYHFPPFDGNVNEGFYDIDEFKDKPAFQQFLACIKGTKLEFEYAKKDGKIFMTIKVG